MDSDPSMAAQVEFWTDWVRHAAGRDTDPDNIRRAAHVLEAVESVAGPGLRILEVGCGTGWLARLLTSFGHVTAVDLPSEALTHLRESDPQIEWISGDFLHLELPGTYDVVVSLETIAHVPDQARFVDRIAEVLVPHGTVVLTTQNPTVWNRTSALRPPGPGQIRNWPSRRRLRALFAPRFVVRSLHTCAPGGDRGWVGLMRNRYLSGLGRRVLGARRWTQVQERLGLGRSLVLVATRTS
ncbi:class I SAM-dependent methyltransferase [Rhodococcus ruber]|uniref:class I SAM-dependent methyltransferase n=1 Tax=Rhodococcus ruber TaxID=1830 RepID=UPI001932AAB1|nr:class I SAM-dependent methyltransferase [Rhodococcus ruber]QRE79998.1 class I SAM-dependent methyltransferase [Rhodococcus ruber]